MILNAPMKTLVNFPKNFREDFRLLASTISDQKIVECFWIFIALTTPFFAVDFQRVDLGAFHLAYPMFGFIAIFYAGILMFLITQGKTALLYRLKSFTLLGFFCSALAIWAFISLLQSVDTVLGIKEVVKLFTGIFAFWLTITFFPRNPRFIRTFFIVVFISWSLMLLRLLYQYAIVFHVSYLSIGLEDADRHGKSILAANILFFFYYAFFYLWFGTKKKFLFFIPVCIATISLIYTGARMGWICIAVALFYIVMEVRKRDRKKGTKLAKQIVFGVLLIAGVGLLALSHFIDLFEVSARLISIFSPGSLSQSQAYLGRNSYNLRGDTLLQALEGFLTSPLIGVGVANTLEYVERLTHNDFMTVLLELGVIGEIFFIGMIILIWKQVRGKKTQKGNIPPWYVLAGRANALSVLLSILFYNCYNTIYFWFYLALSIVMVKTAEEK